MDILALAADERVADVEVTEDELAVRMMDGRAISVPLMWYPRLFNATPEQRKNWRISGGGYGIHWEDVDEDLSVKGMLRGIAAPRFSSPAMTAVQAKEYESSESGQANLDSSPIEDTAEDYQKGILDFAVDIEKASQELLSIMMGIITQISDATNKLEKRAASINSVKTSPAGASPTGINTIVLLMASDMTEFSKGIEEATLRFNSNTNILENGISAFVALLQPEDGDSREQLDTLKDSLPPLLESVNGIKESVAEVKDIIQAASKEGLSYAITKATNRLWKAFDGLIKSLNEFQSFALRVGFQIDEKLGQA